MREVVDGQVRCAVVVDASRPARPCRDLLDTVEAMAPVALWVDEIEKRDPPPAPRTPTPARLDE
jgi:hypothetical protein